MRALLAVGTCAALLVLGGCGGGDGDSDPTATTASTPATAPQATTQTSTGGPRPSQQGAGAGLRGGQGGGGGGSSAKQSHEAVKVPPISSAPIAGTKAPAPGVKTVKGADDSVQTYGVESDEAARTEAAIALAAYLDARLREDWASACEALAQRPKEQLEKLTTSASGQGKEINGCAGAMAAVGGSQQFPGKTITEVLSLRGGGDIPGDPSYLIFAGPPGNTLYSMPMYLQGGGWKVGLAVPAELPL